MTNYVIGLIGNKEGIVEFCNCFGEISTKVYSELYKTKHGRKEVAVKYYSIEDLISSTSNHIMKVGNTNRELISKDLDMSLSDLKNEIKESIDNSLWIKVLENLIKKDYKSNNPTELYILVHVNSIEEKAIIDKMSGDMIYISKEVRPIEKLDFIKHKWNAFKDSSNLYYTYTLKDFWYQNNKTRQYTKSFCVDYIYKRNPLFRGLA